MIYTANKTATNSHKHSHYNARAQVSPLMDCVVLYLFTLGVALGVAGIVWELVRVCCFRLMLGGGTQIQHG